MKNSSRLVEKIERNFRRSSRGIFASMASSRTRLLNSSQLSSRFRKRHSPGSSCFTRSSCRTDISKLLRSAEIYDPFPSASWERNNFSLHFILNGKHSRVVVGGELSWPEQS